MDYFPKMATGKKGQCGMKTEVFSRVCGYHRPVKNWNKGKVAEFVERKVYVIPQQEAVKDEVLRITA